ncbi:MAG: hypothetical protein PUC12_03900 [Clostridiales bacterium]|nr:hypothetical protein [Clostridiales bacterium]
MGKKEQVSEKQITEQKENRKKVIVKMTTGEDILDDLDEKINDVHYRMQCQYAINMVELKIQMLSEEMTEEKGRRIVSCISSRIKTAESIRKKLQKKKLPLSSETAAEKLTDMVGVRVTCLFVDDIYEIVKRFLAQEDIQFIKEKDYIKKPKRNGYHSLHLIVTVPVYSEDKCELKKVEIQFRTVAMDFWAQLDYQLCYKREMYGEESADIQNKLSKYADEIAQMDSNMLKIRRQIEKM